MGGGLVVMLGALAMANLAASCASPYGAGAQPTGDEGGLADGAIDQAADAQKTPEGGANDAMATDGGRGFSVVATGLGNLTGIAADIASVYVAQVTPSASIRKVTLPSGPVLTLEALSSPPFAVALNGTDVLSGGDSPSLIQRFHGGAGTTVVLASPPRALAAGGGAVFVAMFDGATSQPGELRQFVTDLSTNNIVATSVSDVAADGTQVYWTDGTNGNVMRQQFSAAATPAALAAGQSGCDAIAVDELGVYWTRPSAGLVLAGASSGAVMTLAMGEMSPSSIAADGSGVYWLTGDGVLRHYDRGTAKVESLATGFVPLTTPSVHALALTSRYIVWLTGDGQVLLLSK